MKDVRDYRLLFVGGKKRNIPEGKILCYHEQYEQDSKEHDRCELPIGKNGFHMVLCFKDFASHEATEGFKAKAKLVGIPYVQASGGLGALLEQARKQGYDLSPVVKNGREKPAPPPPPEKVWPPKGTKPVALAGGLRAHIMVNRHKELSLVMGGGLLAEAIKIVKAKKMGKGKNGGLTPSEGALLAEELDKRFGYTERGYKMSAAVYRAVNVGLGVSKKYKGPPKPSAPAKPPKVTKKEKKERRPKLEEEIDDEVDAKLDLKTGKVRGKRVEVFLENISGALKEMLRQSAKQATLFEKIIELQVENTFYLEKIANLEAEKAALQKEVRDLKELIAK